MPLQQVQCNPQIRRGIRDVSTAISQEQQTNSPAGASTPGKPESLIFALALTALFFLVAAVGIAHHELWMDEMQSWLIARDASNLPQLFDNAFDELHPMLWYLCLFVVSRFTHAPEGMQILQLAIATGSAFLIARYSPFPKWMKAMVVFGYFFAFEYGVMSRMYGLGALLLVAFLVVHTRKKSYPWMFVILAALANTSVFGLIIAISAGTTLIFEALLAGQFAKLPRQLSIRKNILRISAICAVVLALIGISCVRIFTPKVIKWCATLRDNAALHHPSLGQATHGVVTAYIPFPSVGSVHFWNSCIASHYLHGDVQWAALAAPILIFWAVIFRRRPIACFM
ncbi:MAG: hypothetical protein ACRD3W_07990, partial [Terriglobales bacterium]